MDTTSRICKEFFRSSPQQALWDEINVAYKELSVNLCRSDMVKVLRIIDNCTLIEEIHNFEAYNAGFKTALEIMIELRTVDRNF